MGTEFSRSLNRKCKGPETGRDLGQENQHAWSRVAGSKVRDDIDRPVMPHCPPRSEGVGVLF